MMGCMQNLQPNPQHNEQRLTALEIKASFQEDALDELNKVVVRQQDQIDLLLRELAALRQQLEEASVAAPRSLRDDLPPHY
jgi:SlyX protein